MAAILLAVAVVHHDTQTSPGRCLSHSVSLLLPADGAFNKYGGEGPYCPFDDPDDWGEWEDETQPANMNDEPPLESGGWDDYGYVQAPPSDSEASTAMPEPYEPIRIEDHVVPPWDLGIPSQALDSWTDAEKKVGVKRSVAGWLKAKRRTSKRSEIKQLAPPLTSSGLASYPCDAYAGAVNGYYFGTRGDMLGYHKFDQRSPATVISLSDLLKAAPSGDAPSVVGTAKRRQRGENGARIRGISKRWHAIRGEELQRTIHLHPSASDITVGPPTRAGLWTVDLANANSFATAADKVLRRSAADAALLIETKKREADVHTAAATALRLGWRTSFSAAHATSLTGTSGGTAVATKKGLGHIPNQTTVKEEYRQDWCRLAGGCPERWSAFHHCLPQGRRQPRAYQPGHPRRACDTPRDDQGPLVGSWRLESDAAAAACIRLAEDRQRRNQRTTQSHLQRQSVRLLRG